MSSDERKELQAKLGSLNTYVVATLTLLVVLSIVIDQKIREDASTLRNLSRVRRRSAILTGASPAKLTDLRTQFYESLSAAQADLPPPLEDRDEQTPFLSPMSEMGRVSEYVWFHGPFALSREANKTMDEALSRALVRDEKARALKIETVKELLQAQINQGVIQYRQPMAALLAYDEEVRRGIENAGKSAAAGKQLQDLQAQKQTVPSPFGNFEMRPRLALLLLAATAALSYVVFLLALARILPHEIQDSDSADFDPPAWLYSSKRSVHELFGWQTGDVLYHLVTTLCIHGTWIVLSVGLAIECYRWNAFGALLVSNFTIIKVVKIALFLTIVILLVFAGSWVVTHRGRYGDGPLLVSRRRLVILVSLGLLTATVVQVRRLLRRTGPLPKIAPDKLQLQSTPLVVNPTTKVAHHPRACRKHLPKKRRATKETWLHRGREAMILTAVAADIDASIEVARYEAIFDCALNLGPNVYDQLAQAKNVLRQRGTLGEITREHVSRSIDSVLDAIAIEPLGVHLYDEAIRRFGRLKQYDRIEPLLDQGIASAIAAEPDSKRESAKRSRVIAALKTRKQELKKKRTRKDKRPSGAIMLPGTAAGSEPAASEFDSRMAPPPSLIDTRSIR